MLTKTRIRLSRLAKIALKVSLTLAGPLFAFVVFSQDQIDRSNSVQVGESYFRDVASSTSPSTPVGSPETDFQKKFGFPFFESFAFSSFRQRLNLTDSAVLRSLMLQDEKIFSDLKKIKPPAIADRWKQTCGNSETQWNQGYKEAIEGQGYLLMNGHRRDSIRGACPTLRAQAMTDRKNESVQVQLGCCLAGYTVGMNRLHEELVSNESGLCSMDFELGKENARLACEIGQCPKIPDEQKLIYPGCFGMGFTYASAYYRNSGVCKNAENLDLFLRQFGQDISERVDIEYKVRTAGKAADIKAPVEAGVGK